MDCPQIHPPAASRPSTPHPPRGHQLPAAPFRAVAIFIEGGVKEPLGKYRDAEKEMLRQTTGLETVVQPLGKPPSPSKSPRSESGAVKRSRQDASGTKMACQSEMGRVGPRARSGAAAFSLPRAGFQTGHRRSTLKDSKGCFLASRFYRLLGGHAMMGSLLKDRWKRGGSDSWWCDSGQRRSRGHPFKECQRWKGGILEP